MGCQPRRRAGSAVHQGRSKKLLAALLYDLEQKGTDDFLADIASEEPDAAAFLAASGRSTERPLEAEWPAWSGHLQAALYELRDDRFRGAMGGTGRIYFAAIDRYADRHGINGDDFDFFLWGLRVLDEGYVKHVQALEAQQTKKRENPDR